MQLPPETSDQRLWRAFGKVLGIVVVLYLFFDRGFAHFHIPHTPAYVGEMVIAFGIGCAAVSTRWVRRAPSGDTLIHLAIAWMLWGLLRTIPDMHVFGIQNSVHDAALCYDMLFRPLFVTAATAAPDLPLWWLRWFSRLDPPCRCGCSLTLLLNKTGVKGPTFRFDNVPFLSHKPGNVCVAATLCLAFLWLVPVLRHRRFTLVGFSVVNLITIVFGATQTRGGGLAAAIAIVIGPRHHRPTPALRSNFGPCGDSGFWLRPRLHHRRCIAYVGTHDRRFRSLCRTLRALVRTCEFVESPAPGNRELPVLALVEI